MERVGSIVYVVQHFVVNLSDEFAVSGREQHGPTFRALSYVPVQRLPPFVRL